MLTPLSLLIGLRFSRGRRRSAMVSLVSIFSTIGIALGVAVLIVGLSAMNGFERELDQRILSVVPHGEISPVNHPLRNWPRLVAQITQVEGIVAASPYVEFTGLIENGAKLRAVQVRGVDIKQETQISALPHYVQDRAWSRFQAGQQQVILGKGVADALQVKSGDWVTMMVQTPDPQMKLLQPKRIRLQVAGILQLNGLLDHSLALLPLADAQRSQNLGEGVTGIEIKVNDPYRAHQIVRTVGEMVNDYVYIRSWQSTYGYMFRDIQTIRAIMYLAMALVISVACFNIVSTLVMAVKDKGSDIAVLRTLGAKDGLIRAIFVWYGLLAGMIGTLSGTVFGVMLSLNLTTLTRWVENLLGYHFFSSDIYPIDFLPSELHWIDVTRVLLLALILSLLASWYPARRASRLDPVRLLSGGQ